MKPRLTFYTNMPTPYQLDFFDALQELFHLHVVYFTAREADRSWNLNYANVDYKITVLKNSWLARKIQKKIVSFHFSAAIFGLIRKEQTDFVVVNGTYWSPNVVIAILLHHLKKQKVAFWSEPIFPTASTFKFRIKKMLLAPVRRRTTMLLAIGSAAEESFKRYGYSKPIHRLPYNINTGLFDRQLLNGAQLLELNIKYKQQARCVFLASGSLIHRKGMDILIRAMKLLGQSQVNLLIIGDGPELPSLRALVADDPRVFFLGFKEKEELPYWFNMADVFVTASRYDGWALVINEALAAGLPVISSDKVGAARDLLEHNYNALICANEDVHAFAHAMQELMVDKPKRERLSANAARSAIKGSSDYNARQLFNIYSAL